MFWFIKQVVIELLSFGGSLATKCVSLNSIEPCITRLTLIDLNPVELNYYPFMISLDKCNGSCMMLMIIAKNMCSYQNKRHKP